MRNRVVLLALLMLGCGACSLSDGFDRSVRQAVERQLEVYPESTLLDIYKDLFQDRMGPGHMMADTAAAGRYLRHELATMERCDGRLFEPTGREGHFYRVNLSLIRDSLIGYDCFFDLFVRSVQGMQPMPLGEWRKEWLRMERVISDMRLDLPGFDVDRVGIRARLDAGEYVGHHSPSFEKSYAPHYRIISRELVERELWPLLPDSLRVK